MAKWRDEQIDAIDFVIVDTDEQKTLDQNIAVETALLHVEQALLAIFTGTDPYPEDGEALPTHIVEDMATRVRELLGDKIHSIDKEDIHTLLLVIFETRKDLLDKRFAIAREEGVEQ